MRKYLRSILTATIVFLLVVVINFLLPRLLPGDPIAYLSGFEENSMSEEKYNYYYEELHLGESGMKQFSYYLESIFDGSLGFSYQKNKTVSVLIKERLSATLQIALPSVLLSSFAGLFWGLRAGQKRGKAGERLSSGFNVVLNSLPVFVIAILALFGLAFRARLFPYSGLSSAGGGGFGDRLWHLVLPVFSLFLAELPSRYLLVRNQTAAQMGEKYVLYARQRGLSEGLIRRRYILPNISAPFISMLGVSVASAIGGSVVIENIFSINGMGLLLTGAVHSLDYPLMQGILFVCSLIMTVSIIVCDLLCILMNPKLRSQGTERGGGHEE